VRHTLSEYLTRVGHMVEVESELPRSVSDMAPPRRIVDPRLRHCRRTLSTRGPRDHTPYDESSSQLCRPSPRVGPIRPCAECRRSFTRRSAESLASPHRLTVVLKGSSLWLWKNLGTWISRVWISGVNVSLHIFLSTWNSYAASVSHILAACLPRRAIGPWVS